MQLLLLLLHGAVVVIKVRSIVILTCNTIWIGDCSFLADNLACSISLKFSLGFKFRGLVLNL